MDENVPESIENKEVLPSPAPSGMDSKPIAAAIVVAGVLIAGAVLLRGSTLPQGLQNDGIPVTTNSLAPIGPNDRTVGNNQAKVTLILYEDFQCPFCGAISGLDPENEGIKYLKQNVDPNWSPALPVIISDYVNKGTVLLVYRDFPFLGPESGRSAEAARCAGDQGKFWQYHDYLYGHQAGENKGAFSDVNLKSFAKILNLNTVNFDQCLDTSKYASAVADSKSEGSAAGVEGTPKGFILKDGKIVATIDGAESWNKIKPKIDSALR